MSSIVANQPILPRLDGAQDLKHARNQGSQEGSAINAAQSVPAVARPAPVDISSAPLDGASKLAPPDGGGITADGARSLGKIQDPASSPALSPAKADAGKSLGALSSRASSFASPSASLIAAQEAYNADPGKIHSPVAGEAGQANGQTGNPMEGGVPRKSAIGNAAVTNAMATYSSLSSVSLAADIRIKRAA